MKLTKGQIQSLARVIVQNLVNDIDEAKTTAINEVGEYVSKYVNSLIETIHSYADKLPIEYRNTAVNVIMKDLFYLDQDGADRLTKEIVDKIFDKPKPKLQEIEDLIVLTAIEYKSISDIQELVTDKIRNKYSL